MKWTYRECIVSITAHSVKSAFGSSASFRPIVKIDCNSRDPPIGLTTGKTFLTTELALEFGQEIAGEWIDGHFNYPKASPGYLFAGYASYFGAVSYPPSPEF